MSYPFRVAVHSDQMWVHVLWSQYLGFDIMLLLSMSILVLLDWT